MEAPRYVYYRKVRDITRKLSGFGTTLQYKCNHMNRNLDHPLRPKPAGGLRQARWRRLCCAAIGGSILAGAPQAQSLPPKPPPEAIFPLRDIRPGMHGVGKTIFRGTKIEEFQVEVLGVLENTGPRQSIVLAKLTGGPLAETGVIQGMSGSPVYIDGKLVGAVALGFPFAKDAITGIQPIEQMLRDAVPAQRPSRGQTAGQATRMEANSADLFPGAPGHPLLVKNAVPSDFPSGESAMRNIETPLVMSGFTERTLEAFAGPLSRLGFHAIGGLGGASPNEASGSSAPTSFAGAGHTAPPTVEPGSMISVQLMSGDMNMAADGTVTYVDGNKIYAFGHRFLATGSADLPFARAEVIAILPNLNASYKISSSHEWLGTMTSDRSTAVAGEIGLKADLVPVTISVAPSGGAERRYKVEIVNDRLLTPFLLQLALFSAIDATERTIGVSSLRAEGRVVFEGTAQPLTINNVFASDLSVAMGASANMVVPLSFALEAGFPQLRVKSADFKLLSAEEKKSLQIDQIWASARQVAPGGSVDVSVLFTGESGVEIVRHASVRIPVGAQAGVLNLTVSDANGLNFPELAGLSPSTVSRPDELLKELSAIRPSDQAYLRVWRQEPTFPVAGREIADPPPSIAMVMNRTLGTGIGAGAIMLVSARGATIEEIEMSPGNYVVSGSKTIQVEVKE